MGWKLAGNKKQGGSRQEQQLSVPQAHPHHVATASSASCGEMEVEVGSNQPAGKERRPQGLRNPADGLAEQAWVLPSLLVGVGEGTAKRGDSGTSWARGPLHEAPSP